MREDTRRPPAPEKRKFARSTPSPSSSPRRRSRARSTPLSSNTLAPSQAGVSSMSRWPDQVQPLPCTARTRRCLRRCAGRWRMSIPLAQPVVPACWSRTSPIRVGLCVQCPLPVRSTGCLLSIWVEVPRPSPSFPTTASMRFSPKRPRPWSGSMWRAPSARRSCGRRRTHCAKR